MSDDGWEDDGWKDEETSNTTAQVGPGGDGLSPQEGGGGGDGYRREGHFVRECPHGGGGNNKCRNCRQVGTSKVYLNVKSSPSLSIFLSKLFSLGGPLCI